MPDDRDDDEAWSDDQDDFDDETAASCPECGGAFHSIADKCPACGYWLSDADRRDMWSGRSQALWLKVTAVIVLIAFLFSLLAVGAAIF
jgi:ribosomal protein L37E